MSPLKLWNMLLHMKPTEERVSRLTSAATIVDVLDHPPAKSLQPVAADVSPLKLSTVLCQLPSLENGMSRLTSAATMNRMDATKRLPGEGFKRVRLPLIKMDESVKVKMREMPL